LTAALALLIYGKFYSGKETAIRYKV